MSKKVMNFWKKKTLLDTKRAFWFPLQALFGTFLILRITPIDIDMNMHSCSCKLPGILVRFFFYQTWIFSTYFRKILKYKTLWEPKHVAG
jgi:hypothetical protein